MSRHGRDHYRKKLRDLLSRADNHAFLKLVWAVDALQSERMELAAHYIGYPAEAATADMDSSYAVFKWDLETLVNQLLLTPKYEMRPGPNRLTNCTLFNTCAAAPSLLRRLENAEAGIYLRQFSIFTEMHRIGYRQFPWQRGYADRVQLYRYAFIYGQGECAAYFERTNCLTVNDFTLIGFAMYAAAQESPSVGREFTITPLGITSATCERALRLLVRPIAEARSEAAKTLEMANAKHGSPLPTAYQPSLLRQFPLVSFGPLNNDLCAPLPELIFARITSGIFYDLVGGPSQLRNEASRRFEEYCAALMHAMMPRFDVAPSHKYRFRGNPIDTPDVLVKKGGSVAIAIECKATKLSLGAQYADDPITEARGAYDELAKGVYQLWRYFSHARRGIVQSHEVAPDAHGMVLTLDSWLVMDARVLRYLFDAAATLAAADPEITEQDRRPVVFCSIQELEFTLSRTDENALLCTLHAAREERFAGWMLGSVLNETHNAINSHKPYPFDPADVLQWWKATEELQRDRPNTP